MHGCDFTGGAWFRSTNQEEQHVFFDPQANQLYKNDGTNQSKKLILVANSKRGHYLTVVWDSNNGESILGYSNPSSFWAQNPSGKKVKGGELVHKFTRLDVPNNNSRIYFFGLRKDIGTNPGNQAVSSMRQSLYASYVSSSSFVIDKLEV
jgi:hypothetical protein